MIRRLLIAISLICFTTQVSWASYNYVQGGLNHDSLGADGKRAAQVLLFLWHHSTMADGTELDTLRGISWVSVENHPLTKTVSACPPVRRGNAVYYTDHQSPECAAKWLGLRDMDSLVTAAVNLALSQQQLFEDRLQVTSGQGYIGVVVNSKSRDLGDGTVDIYDASGKLMDAHMRLQTTSKSDWYTLSTSGMPPGPYKAVLRKKNGQTIETLFVLR